MFTYIVIVIVVMSVNEC